MRRHRGRMSTLALVVALAGCTPATRDTEASTSAEPTVSSVASASPSEQAEAFPAAAFADIREDPVSEATAAEFQAALSDMAGGAGMAATVMTATARGAERRARRTTFETFGSTISSRSPASRSRWSQPR